MISPRTTTGRGRRRAAMPATLLLPVLALVVGASAAARADGIFVADCGFSHRAADDPIVFHGMPGWSHSHDFFGNGSTEPSSTLESLRRSAGNCVPAQDRAGYWTPTLYRRGWALKAVHVQAYYQDFFRYGRVLPFPPGLRMVAGRPAARAPQRGVVRWTCQEDHGQGDAKVPSCGSKFVTLRITFPDCWDGWRLDSPDHRSHMAYNDADGVELGLQRCPRRHPIVVPQVQLNVVYPSHDGKRVTLASGSVLTAHADFFNGWKPSVLRHRVHDILNGGKACDDYLGCAIISAPNTEPVTARPKVNLVTRFYRPRSPSGRGHRRHG